MPSLRREQVLPHCEPLSSDSQWVWATARPDPLTQEWTPLEDDPLTEFPREPSKPLLQLFLSWASPDQSCSLAPRIVPPAILLLQELNKTVLLNKLI